MRFRRSSTRPPYLNTADQMRMLGLVGLLVLVLIAMKVAANPNTWAWMFPHKQPTPQRTMPEQTDRVARPESAKGVESTKPRPPFRSGRATPAELDPSLLSGIRDNTLGVRREEADAFFALLAEARKFPLRTLERIARDDVTFTVLMVDGDDFRGKLVTVDGEVKRLSPFPAGPNQHGLKQLYELWMLTPDSGANPIRVVCTEIPQGMPQGETIERPVEVRVTGYFFKREGYASQGGLRVAPLILAKRPHWFRPAMPAPVDRGLAPWLAGVLLLIAAALGLTVWRLSERDRAIRRGHLKRLTEAPPKDIRALQGLEVSDPAEVLRQLVEVEAPPDSKASSNPPPQQRRQPHDGDAV